MAACRMYGSRSTLSCKNCSSAERCAAGCCGGWELVSSRKPSARPCVISRSERVWHTWYSQRDGCLLLAVTASLDWMGGGSGGMSSCQVTSMMVHHGRVQHPSSRYKHHMLRERSTALRAVIAHGLLPCGVAAAVCCGRSAPRKSVSFAATTRLVLGREWGW